MDLPNLDRLMMLIVSGFQSATLMKHLRQKGFNFTVMDSTSGIVNEPMVCLLVGFLQERMTSLLALIRQDCRPYRQYIPTQGPLPGKPANLPMVEARLGGALVCMMNVERFEQF